MKLFANKKIFKKIVIMLVTIMMITTLMPLHQVSADSDQDFAGALFRPICQLLAGLGDLFISGLQWVFIGDATISTTIEDWGSEFLIRYSPALIFSNEVPGLDANFIKPKPDKDVMKLDKKVEKCGKDGNQDYTFNLGDPNDESYLEKNYGFKKDELTPISNSPWISLNLVGISRNMSVAYSWYNSIDKNNYMLIKTMKLTNNSATLLKLMAKGLKAFDSERRMETKENI